MAISHHSKGIPMSKESDTTMAQEYRHTLIEKNMSIDTCKECEYFLIIHDSSNCLNDQPEVHTCNLLKIFYTK